MENVSLTRFCTSCTSVTKCCFHYCLLSINCLKTFCLFKTKLFLHFCLFWRTRGVFWCMFLDSIQSIFPQSNRYSRSTFQTFHPRRTRERFWCTFSNSMYSIFLQNHQHSTSPFQIFYPYTSDPWVYLDSVSQFFPQYLHLFLAFS